MLDRNPKKNPNKTINAKNSIPGKSFQVKGLKRPIKGKTNVPKKVDRENQH